ncbi:MAG TPA: reverse transcriptase family protein [Kofleriaceae bacterium]|nr:reverse transcriptase family protein [Kofleriaceae bacterium]
MLARAMVDGAWLRADVAARLERLVGQSKSGWMGHLAAIVCANFEVPPGEKELDAWLYEQDKLAREDDEDGEDDDVDVDEDGEDDDADVEVEGVIARSEPPAALTIHDVLNLAAMLVREWPLTPPEMSESPWPVQPFATTGDLARWLGVEVGRLVALADRRRISQCASDERRRHYRYRWIAKRSSGGGQRLIEAPKSRLRVVQRRLLDDIVSRIPPHDACHGFRAGRSVRTFAAAHVGHEVVIRIDLQSFFASVFAPRVVAVMRTAGYPDGVARTIAALCTHATPYDVIARAAGLDAVEKARLRAPHLPQGAPSSGALANLAAFGFDVRVAAFADAIGAIYTRYADDVAISGGRELARRASSIVARVGAIAHDERFAVNFRKTRVMVRSARQRIAGVVVNEKLGVARDELDRLRATLHNCVRTGPAAQNRDGHADFRAHLLGRVSWIASLDPAKGAKLMDAFRRIAW